MTFDTKWGRDAIQFGGHCFRGECTLRPEEDATFGEWEITVNLCDWNPKDLPQIGVPGYLKINDHEEWVFPVYVSGFDPLPFGKARLRISSIPRQYNPQH